MNVIAPRSPGIRGFVSHVRCHATLLSRRGSSTFPSPCQEVRKRKNSMEFRDPHCTAGRREPDGQHRTGAYTNSLL
jgi:hypothetical protein